MDYPKNRPQCSNIADIKGKDFVILGCAPSLNKFDYAKYVKANSVVIAINTAFLRWPCDILFCSDKRFIKKNRRKISTNTRLVVAEKFLSWFGYKHYNIFWIYKPAAAIGKDPESLALGYSSIIPALHFSLMLAKTVIVTGFELNNNSHWNRDNKNRRFPKAFEIRNRVLEIQQIFQKKINFV